MKLWLAALLGIVQGLTEFLPVSSSGHLVLLQDLLGEDVESSYMMFDILLHFGTLVSVCLCFWKDIKGMVREFFGLCRDLSRKDPQINKTPMRRQLMMVIIATIPMVVAVFINDYVESLFSSSLMVGFALLVTSVLLYVSELRPEGTKTAANAGWRDALIIGIMQLVAIIPGISRSGTAITGGRLCGFKYAFAMKFAFLMSIPVILGANIITFVELLMAAEFDSAMILPCIVGVILAAVTGVLAIGFVRYLTRKKTFRPFAYYCATLGVVVIVLNLIF